MNECRVALLFLELCCSWRLTLGNSKTVLNALRNCKMFCSATSRDISCWFFFLLGRKKERERKNENKEREIKKEIAKEREKERKR